MNLIQTNKWKANYSTLLTENREELCETEDDNVYPNRGYSQNNYGCRRSWENAILGAKNVKALDPIIYL